VQNFAGFDYHVGDFSLYYGSAACFFFLEPNYRFLINITPQIHIIIIRGRETVINNFFSALWPGEDRLSLLDLAT
jgi:hypothetical protein